MAAWLLLSPPSLPAILPSLITRSPPPPLLISPHDAPTHPPESSPSQLTRRSAAALAAASLCPICAAASPVSLSYPPLSSLPNEQGPTHLLRCGSRYSGRIRLRVHAHLTPHLQLALGGEGGNRAGRGGCGIDRRSRLESWSHARQLSGLHRSSRVGGGQSCRRTGVWRRVVWGGGRAAAP